MAKYRKKPVIVEAEINKHEVDCERCKYYRHMKGWPETYMACHYTEETGQKLEGDIDWCSGFTEKEA